MIQIFQKKQENPVNRAFLLGDAVWVTFYLRNSEMILIEESYFYLMASMRKLRLNIPEEYTLEFFSNLFQSEVIDKGFQNAFIKFLVFRDQDNQENIAKSGVQYYFEVHETADVLMQNKDYEIDLIKEINVNNNLFSNLHVHSPENIYANIYAKENDLDDVILLNPNKRIARTSEGDILLLKGNELQVPKSTEGAFISPLLEAFVTFLDKNSLVLLSEAELIAFETQKSDEILIISETTGIHCVTKVRNKEFGKTKFESLLERWRNSFEN